MELKYTIQVNVYVHARALCCGHLMVKMEGRAEWISERRWCRNVCLINRWIRPSVLLMKWKTIPCNLVSTDEAYIAVWPTVEANLLFSLFDLARTDEAKIAVWSIAEFSYYLRTWDNYPVLWSWILVCREQTFDTHQKQLVVSYHSFNFRVDVLQTAL